jgi:hypothetical protein
LFFAVVCRYYGQLSVPADKKWDEIFHHCCAAMGHDGHTTLMVNTKKAWDMVAVAVSTGKKHLLEMQETYVLWTRTLTLKSNG